MNLSEFREQLLQHYQAHKRSMPWRETRDPYAILVSELMLQQTQVKTVIPYYLRFMERYPTAADLAASSEEELLKMWQGLGYYRRARNLQKAAQQICERHNGLFPEDKESIDALTGVGPYTSAAVASIALDLPHACVDGNVIRVITRLDASDADVTATKERKRIAVRASELLSEDQPGDFNQAMMELGATVCTPRNPSCLTCPVATHCQTQKRGDDPHQRPFKRKRVQASAIDLDALFLYSGKQFLLARRPPEGLMAGMWELPAQSREGARAWKELVEGSITVEGHLAPVLHRFTHLHATTYVTVAHCTPLQGFKNHPTSYAEVRVVTLDDLDALPVTKVFSKLLPQLNKILEGASLCPPSPSLLPGV